LARRQASALDRGVVFAYPGVISRIPRVVLAAAADPAHLQEPHQTPDQMLCSSGRTTKTASCIQLGVSCRVRIRAPPLLSNGIPRPGTGGNNCAQVDGDVLRRVGLRVGALARPVRSNYATRAVRLVLAPVQRQGRREVALARIALVPLPAMFLLLSKLELRQAMPRTSRRKL